MAGLADPWTQGGGSKISSPTDKSGFSRKKEGEEGIFKRPTLAENQHLAQMSSVPEEVDRSSPLARETATQDIQLEMIKHAPA